MPDYKCKKTVNFWKLLVMNGAPYGCYSHLQTTIRRAEQQRGRIQHYFCRHNFCKICPTTNLKIIRFRWYDGIFSNDENADMINFYYLFSNDHWQLGRVRTPGFSSWRSKLLHCQRSREKDTVSEWRSSIHSWKANQSEESDSGNLHILHRWGHKTCTSFDFKLSRSATWQAHTG